MPEKELMILRLLIEHPDGLFGSDFVEISGGILKRGTIYTTLDRMVAKGYEKESQIQSEVPHLTARTRHSISAAGRKAYEHFLQKHGLSICHGSLSGVQV
jgi:DNA-binding PadR family transcriptional regulator